MDWDWIRRSTDEILAMTVQHSWWSVAAVLAGLIAALPVGYIVYRTGRLSGIWLALVGLLYAIPSVALFVVMPVILGTGILDPLNVIGALAVYCFALLVRSVRDGFAGVAVTVRQSATAMGFGPGRRVLQVELPLAMPVIFAGLRVATVSTISLVSVGAVIGNGALGQLFDLGFRSGFATPILVGIVVILVLALIADGLILLMQRITLPWFGLGARTSRRKVGVAR